MTTERGKPRRDEMLGVITEPYTPELRSKNHTEGFGGEAKQTPAEDGMALYGGSTGKLEGYANFRVKSERLAEISADVSNALVWLMLGKCDMRAGRQLLEDVESFLRSIAETVGEDHIPPSSREADLVNEVKGLLETCDRKDKRIAEQEKEIAGLYFICERKDDEIEKRGKETKLALDTANFLESDRMAIVAERNEALEQVREMRAVIANPNNADLSYSVAAKIAQLESVIRPSDIDRLKQRAPESLTAQEAAEVALWEVLNEGRAIRFVAELATMTDTECEFLDGSEVRALCRLLQVPSEAVTVPRLYTEEDRKRGMSAIWQENRTVASHQAGRFVDAVAEALGLRRAGA